MSKSKAVPVSGKLPPLLPAYQAARLLGIGVKVLRNLIRGGKIPVQNLGTTRVRIVTRGLIELYGRELLESRAHLLKAK